MTIEEVITLMSQMKGVVSSHVLETSRRIYALASRYGYLKESFSFNADADLDREVNRLLIELSDRIMQETVKRARKTVDAEEEDTAILYMRENQHGKSLEERTDMHCTHLKQLLEAYFALSFSLGRSDRDTEDGILPFLTQPLRYVANPHFGQGYQDDPIKALTVLTQNSINTAYQRGMLGKFSRQGVRYYKVHRGSTFDCELCDSLCVGVHPVTEMVLPAHPRCCCYITPVTDGD